MQIVNRALKHGYFFKHLNINESSDKLLYVIFYDFQNVRNLYYFSIFIVLFKVYLRKLVRIVFVIISQEVWKTFIIKLFQCKNTFFDFQVAEGCKIVWKRIHIVSRIAQIENFELAHR